MPDTFSGSAGVAYHQQGQLGIPPSLTTGNHKKVLPMKQPIEKTLKAFLVAFLLIPGACKKPGIDQNSEIKASIPSEQNPAKDKNIFLQADQFLDGANLAHCNDHKHNLFCFSSQIASSDLGSFTVSDSYWMVAKSASQDGFAHNFSSLPYQGGIIFSVDMQEIGQPNTALLKTDLSVKLTTETVADIRSQKPITFSGAVAVGRVWGGNLEHRTVRSFMGDNPPGEKFRMDHLAIYKEKRVPQLGPRKFDATALAYYHMKIKIHSYAKGQCEYRAYMYRDRTHPHVAGFITGTIEAPAKPEKGKYYPSDARFNTTIYEKYPPAPYVVEQWSKVFDKGDTMPCL